jgi:hypothetical protein
VRLTNSICGLQYIESVTVGGTLASHSNVGTATSFITAPPIKMRTTEIQIVKVKVKFTLEQATKAQRGSRRIALLSL